jgi:hypothetical protein
LKSHEQELRDALLSAYDFGSEYPHPLLISRIYTELDRPVAKRHRRSWVGGAAAAALAMIVVVSLVWSSLQRASTPSSSGPLTSGPEAGTAAILTNNHLVYLTPGDTQPYWDLALAAPPDLTVSHGYSGLGHRIAATADGALIYALPARDVYGGDRLVFVGTQSSALLRQVQLPNPDGSARYGAVTVGPSGDAWVVGSVDKHIEIVRVNRQDGTIASWSGRDMSHWAPQGPVGGDYQIYEVQVTADEQRVYYSYTGGLLSLAGMDWVDLAGQRATTCTPSAADQACVPGLAGFLVSGNDVFITTANDLPTGAIDHYALDGTLKDHIELGLLPGFLEDFAVGPEGNNLYLVGSCGYSGGMAVLDIATLKPIVIVQAEPAHSPPTKLPCGQSSAFVSNTLIALGHVSALLPADAAGQILFVDSSTGRIVRSVPVSSEPIAVAALH